ncbi:hypothetical protein DYB35_011946 [Aphanomyces astaci]|uniref:DUF6818 domain-containing protein n=1 Tax=Aphanomyces astaci TaxID=112090 RepID=A0A3R6ZT37_APHAT|nr:hypothetical protein DYB35_011946 [Aphanomyces astaci]
MATNSKAATRAASKRSAPNWNDKDVEILLDCIQDLVPLGQNGWAKVTQQFNSHNNVAFARDWEACKRKFTFLKSVKKPTGDPDCPSLVVRAKRIQRDIDSRAAVEVLDDEGEMNADSLKTFFDQDVDHMPTLDVTPDVNVSENVAEEGDNDDSQIDVTDNVDFKEEIDTSQTFLPLKRQKTSLKEKPNRSGLSQDSLRQLGKRLSKVSEGTSSVSSLSAVAKRRQSLDAFIDQAGKQQSASNDMMSMFCLMEDRKEKRQDEREERERQQERQQGIAREEREYQQQLLRDEREERERQQDIARKEREYQQQLLRDEREERRRSDENEYRARQEQFQMAIMMKLLGDTPKKL